MIHDPKQPGACPILPLADEAERLVRVADVAEDLQSAERREGRDGAYAERDMLDAFDRIHAIQARACDLAPTSPAGALFLLATLSGEFDDYHGSAHDDCEKRTLERRIDRGLYGLRRFLEAHFGDVGPALYMEFVMARRCDPHGSDAASSEAQLEPCAGPAPFTGSDVAGALLPAVDTLDGALRLFGALRMAADRISEHDERNAMSALVDRIGDDLGETRALIESIRASASGEADHVA